MSEDIIHAIQQLLILGKGDAGRLEYLLDLVKKGKDMPDSDQKYLQTIIHIYLGAKGTDSEQKRTEFVIDQLHREIKDLTGRLEHFEKKGFERYVGRKAVLFFITVFVGWNALQSYVQPTLNSLVPSSYLKYFFPLAMTASYFNYDSVVWFGFVVLLLSWPFIGTIYLVKFIHSRKLKVN